jgi:hypothetical protein
MNSGFWWNKNCMKSDDSFWPHLTKDSKKQMLGTYDEFLRTQKKMKRVKLSDEDEEGGEQ